MRESLKRCLSLAVVCSLVFAGSGCETLKRKFIRKPKNSKKTSPVLVPQDYKGIYPNSVLYSNHFIYWRVSTEDLIDCLTHGLSNKRQIEDVNVAIQNLEIMRSLLNSPKKEQLSSYIKFFEDTGKKLKEGQPNDIRSCRIKSDLESRRRVIMREFSSKEVKSFILKDEEPIKPISEIEQKLIQAQ
ncbi:MAG: hypothetical protein V1933_01605 [Candidatus Omnitrophota bacterium]